MAERRVLQADDFQSFIQTNGGTVLTDLASNPGSTPAEVAASTALNQLIVDQALAYGVKGGIIVARADFSGVVRYWRAQDWAALMVAHISTSRTWLSGVATSGALESDLRDDLITAGVSANEAEALATGLTNLLINEGGAETT